MSKYIVKETSQTNQSLLVEVDGDKSLNLFSIQMETWRAKEISGLQAKLKQAYDVQISDSEDKLCLRNRTEELIGRVDASEFTNKLQEEELAINLLWQKENQGKVEALEASCAVMREALQFYADGEHFEFEVEHVYLKDDGKVASKALSNNAGKDFSDRLTRMEGALKLWQTVDHLMTSIGDTIEVQNMILCAREKTNEVLNPIPKTHTGEEK